jgi:signal peptidase I
VLDSNSKAEIKSWLKSLVIALGLVVLIRSFLFSPYTVEGASMEPTLHNHEKIFVSKLTLSEANQGEIVIIKGPEKNYVKRIIGLPGDLIEMIDDELFINGKLVNELYLTENLNKAEQMGSKLTGDFGPIKVPKDYYFVMGDNRLKSMDSRNGLGFIQTETIVGTSEFVFYPFPNLRNVE